MAKKISIEEFESKKKEEKKLKPEQKNKLLLPLEILIVLFGISLICIVLLLVNNGRSSSSNEDEISKLKDDLNAKEELAEEYKDDLNRLLGDKDVDYIEEKLEFFDDNVVFRIEGFGNYYYSYDCMLQKVNGNYTYWAYNPEKAAVEGLRPGGC